MFIKPTKNISFPETRKIAEIYMGTKIYDNVVQKGNQTVQESTAIDKYKKKKKNLPKNW